MFLKPPMRTKRRSDSTKVRGGRVKGTFISTMRRSTGLKASHRKPSHDIGMKLPALSILSAALLCAAPAFAQTAPHPTPNPAMRQAFEQMRSRMEGVRRSERAQMLGALKPANKGFWQQLPDNLQPRFRRTMARPPHVGLRALGFRIASRSARRTKRSHARARHHGKHAQPVPGAAQCSALRHERSGWSTARRPAHHTPDAGRMLLGLMGGGPMRMGPPACTAALRAANAAGHVARARIVGKLRAWI